MKSGGDILVVQKESERPFALDTDLATGTGTVHLLAGRTNHTVYVQKITVAILTHADGKTITVQDTAGTPVPIAVVNDHTAAAGVPDVVTFDFGPHGTALTLDKGLDVVNAASGPAARVHVEGYQKLGTTINTGTAASAS